MFWTGTTGKKLRKDPDAQRMAAYLMTGPHSHQSGIYYLPLMYAANEIGMTLEGASEALARLQVEGFCWYDGPSEWIWVKEMASWQIGSALSETDKRCKGVQQYLGTLPKLPFLSEFVERYRGDFHLKSEISPLQGPSDTHERGIHLTGTGTIQEQEGSARETVRSAHEPALNGSGPSGTTKGKTKATPKRKTPKDPEIPLPDDFGLDPEIEQYIVDHLPNGDPRAVVEKFKLQARTKQWRYADWRLAFMTYVRNCAPNSGHWAAGQYPKSAAGRAGWV